MSVDISTLGWATVQSRTGDVEAGVAFTLTDGVGAVALAGATDVNGQIQGLLESGRYTLTIANQSKQVDVVDGAPPSALLGMAAITATPTVTTAVVLNTVTAVNVVGGWKTTVTVVNRPVRVDVFVKAIAHSVGGTAWLILYQDGAIIQGTANVAAYNGPAGLFWIGSPSAGSHTYEVKLVSSATGNITFQTDPSTPAFLTATSL